MGVCRENAAKVVIVYLVADECKAAARKVHAAPAEIKAIVAIDPVIDGRHVGVLPVHAHSLGGLAVIVVDDIVDNRHAGALRVHT